jgi:large subunit ribosomal protein L22
MEAIAKTRHLKGSPRKARLVIDLIRGRNVSQALNILKFTDKRAADPIAKTLRSAIANATYLAEQQNIAIDPDDLIVKTCFVDMGAHKNRRRMRPAPQGRAFREQRHYCHITILVSNDAPTDTKSARKSMQTSGEKGSHGGAKGKESPKPEAIKETTKTATAKDTPKAKETKKAQAEKPAVEEMVGATAPVVEAPIIEKPIVESATTITDAETPKVEESVEAKSPIVETPESSSDNAAAKINESQIGTKHRSRRNEETES